VILYASTAKRSPVRLILGFQNKITRDQGVIFDFLCTNPLIAFLK